MTGFGHFGVALRKITNPQDAPSLALVMGVHRHDKPLKFWLHKIEQMEKRYDAKFQTVFATIKEMLETPVRPKRSIGFHP